MDVKDGKLSDWSLSPVFTDESLTVHMAKGKKASRMLKSFQNVAKKLRLNVDNYNSFYKLQYKKKLLAHSISTLCFEYHKRGLTGLFRILSNRSREVRAMVRRAATDRSAMSYDADAVGKNNIPINKIR